MPTSQPTAVRIRSVTDADVIARELVFLAGPEDLWLLPEDGVIGTCAIDVAVDGCRPVRLTATERWLAARRILMSGGSIHSVCLRLHLPEHTEGRWGQLQLLLASKIIVIIILAAAVAAVIQQTSPAS